MVRELFTSMGPFFSGLFSVCMTLFFGAFWANEIKENPEDGGLKAGAALTAICIIFLWIATFDSLKAAIPKI